MYKCPGLLITSSLMLCSPHNQYPFVCKLYQRPSAPTLNTLVMGRPAVNGLPPLSRVIEVPSTGQRCGLEGPARPPTADCTLRLVAEILTSSSVFARTVWMSHATWISRIDSTSLSCRFRKCCGVTPTLRSLLKRNMW